MQLTKEKREGERKNKRKKGNEEHKKQEKNIFSISGHVGKSIIATREIYDSELEESDDAGNRTSARELSPSEDDQVPRQLSED